VAGDDFYDSLFGRTYSFYFEAITGGASDLDHTRVG